MLNIEYSVITSDVIRGLTVVCLILPFVRQFKNIIIHHERPCRIEIYNPRGWNFCQGRRVLNPWLNSNPGGEIYLFLHGLTVYITWAKEGEVSRDMRFPTMWYV